MKDKGDKFYITTPIYYASGKPHLGHAYTSVACDILARWNRNIGREVFFLTGTDEHGQKVERKAKEAGKSPKEFVDSLIPQFKEMLEVMNISNDFFMRTTDEYHKEFVKEVLQKTYDNGDIYKDEYEGLYCVDCEQYYKEEELEENGICPIHKREVESFKEENYFFKLSKYQDKLLKFYEENPDFLSPKSKAEETINRVKEGLLDISISRNKKTLLWGIELPFDSEHVVYVWFDALYNYISALVENDKKDFWPADVQVVGKDIMWFHKVFWPAFLMSAGYELPKKVFAHGWWTVNNEKMGKALNNVIEPIEMAQKYGTDELRYYLFSLGTFGEDQNFTMESFAEKINNDLNNDLGNLVSRVVSMTNKFFPSGVTKMGELKEVELSLLDKLNMYREFNEYMQNLEYFKSLSLLWDRIRETNAYINRVEPWGEKDERRLSTIMNLLCSACVLFAKYLECFMPQKSTLIFEQFNMENDGVFKLEFIGENHKLEKKINLFEKIKLDNKNEKSNQKIKAIVFDFDGVIHDTFETCYSIYKLFHPEEKREDYKKVFVGNALDYGGKKYTEREERKWRELEYSKCKEIKIDKEVSKELKKLKEKYKLFIVSSNTEKNINVYLKNNGILELFDCVLGEETHKSKHDKILRIFDGYKLNKDNTIFVTDTTGDIKETRDIGLRVIAVDFGYHHREELEKENPYKVVSSFKQIRKEVEKLNDNKEVEDSEEKREWFESLNLKVGKIIEIKEHPEAEKLFIEKIDIGEDEPRQIVSGLKDDYKKEELLGKNVVVVANLKHAKFRGVKSEGMILAAEDSKGNVGIVTTDSDVGENLMWKGKIADSDLKIKVEDFFSTEMKSLGSKIELDSEEVTVDGESLVVDKGIKGSIR